MHTYYLGPKPLMYSLILNNHLNTPNMFQLDPKMPNLTMLKKVREKFLVLSL